MWGKYQARSEGRGRTQESRATRNENGTETKINIPVPASYRPGAMDGIIMVQLFHSFLNLINIPC